MNLPEKLWYLNMAMGIYGCGMYIFLNVIAKSELPVESTDEPTSAHIYCNMAECHQLLQNRLETIESAVRAIVSILSIQKNELFTTVNTMLVHNQAVKEILSKTQFIQNSGDLFSTVGGGPNATIQGTPSNATEGTTLISAIAVKSLKRVFVYFYADCYTEHRKSVGNLKGAIKCSLSNLIDITTKGRKRISIRFCSTQASLP